MFVSPTAFVTSRRGFLKAVSGAAVAAYAGYPLWARAADDKGLFVAEKDGLIVRSYRFLDLETPVQYFNTWITPSPHFFVRNHMHEPTRFDSHTWTLRIVGEVERPLTLNMAALRKREKHSLVNTLECAGNGRGFLNPKVPGVQWGKGAVGTARFAGPRLCDLLGEAGVKPTAKHVSFRGLDEVPGKVPPFIRSIPIEKALDRDTLVALDMNGAPLPHHNGFPARALVPGWIGAASCKWLSEISVLAKEFDGNFMSPGYRMPNQPVKPDETFKPEDTHSVTALNVKSLISTPGNGSTLKSRTLYVQGVAWAGEADVTAVEVSVDGGSTWQRAELGHDQAHYAWRLWSYQWQAPKAGEYVLMSRAMDSQGRTQPLQPVWNPSGYLNNAIDQVKIRVQT
jgi:DMSO/TMAO reductase YedYZ molybdopterin-dependent catalytic subunit